ncbi:hypothetical protein [Arthrobacter rhombi]|uniref:hypothetical protein n=1 Tax=Arthrobacter rhombi TaxID=71253 RepID=UPI003FB9D228
MSKTNVQRRAEKIAALMAEQQVYEAQVKEAVKSAAFARCDAVEQLYDVLDVEPEPKGQRRQKEGAVVEVATDKDETKRAARLVEAVMALVEDRRAPAPSRDDSEEGASVPVHHADR